MSEIEQAPKKKKAPTKTLSDTSANKRIYKQDREINHDLYKLEVAQMMKNMMWHPVPPEDYVKIEHCHFFHTFDSAGIKQTRTTSVGGHFHLVEVIDNGPDAAPTVKCVSGPMTEKRVRNKYTKKYEKKIVPVNDVDNHTHEVTYMQSDVLKLRKMNDEAAKLIGKNAGLTAKPRDLDVSL
jgi:hypothetical protein